MNTKKCSACHVEKGIDQFAKLRKAKDGLQYRCRSCQKVMTDAWAEKNRERKLRTNSAYRAENREKCLAATAASVAKNPEKKRLQVAKWQEENKDHVREVAKRYRESHNEEIRSRIKRWRAENRRMVADKELRRTARIREATPPWADMDAIRNIYQEAAEMRASTGMDYEVDHIVPIGSKMVQGLHIALNLRIVTSKVNKEKGQWKWPDMP